LKIEKWDNRDRHGGTVRFSDWPSFSIFNSQFSILTRGDHEDHDVPETELNVVPQGGDLPGW
jgi:hypothetical protein